MYPDPPKKVGPIYSQPMGCEYTQKDLEVNGQSYTIQYSLSDNRNAIARIRESIITITLPKRWPEKERTDAAQDLEKRIIKKLTKPKIKINAIPENLTTQQKITFARNSLSTVTARVNELNAQYFNSKIGNIRIRSNLTNWGSCSIKNNISINFALLFLPQELMDYVIVHELAHAKIRNHSHKFWGIVEKVLPDYKGRKKELRKYSLSN